MAKRERMYVVGYKQPPKEHQFQKGKSGNPKGRPKGAKNAEIILTEIYHERHDVQVQGKTVKLTTRELLFRAQAKKAAQGDTKAFKLLEQMAQEFGIGVKVVAEQSGYPRVIYSIPDNGRGPIKGPVYREDPTKPIDEWEEVEDVDEALAARRLNVKILSR